MIRHNRLLHRVSWSVFDQGLSAASNLLLSIIVARALDPHGFGAFAVAFLIFGLLISMTRAAIGQPLQITYSGSEPPAFLVAVRSALGASLLFGVVAGLALTAVGLSLSGATGRALIALGVCVPGLLVQDACRMAFFSAGRADRAAVNDGIWTVVEFAALAGVLVSGVRDVAVFIVAWGGAATLAAAFGILVLRAPPLLRGAVRWLLGQRQLTGYLLAENILGLGLAQVGILMLGVVASAADVGSLRAAQVLVGPLNILITAALMFGVPEVARRKGMSRRDRSALCWRLSAAMCAASLTYSALLLLLPDRVGAKLLGDTWSGAQSVLLATCALSVAVAIGVGPGITLYGLGQVRTTFGLNLLKAPILVVLLTGGIWWQGAVGAAWALAATEALVLPFVIVKAQRAMGPSQTGVDAETDLIADVARRAT